MRRSSAKTSYPRRTGQIDLWNSSSYLTNCFTLTTPRRPATTSPLWMHGLCHPDPTAGDSFL